MFEKLRKFFQRDQRPIQRVVEHESLGTLNYSDDDEAWATDPSLHNLDFPILIDGNWFSDATDQCIPAPTLIEWAERIVSDPAAFRKELSDFIASEIAVQKSLRHFYDEIKTLEIEFVSLGPEKRPGEGSIYFKEFEGIDRCWRCDFIDFKLTNLGFDS